MEVQGGFGGALGRQKIGTATSKGLPLIEKLVK